VRILLKKITSSEIFIKTIQVSVLTALIKVITFLKDILIIRHFPFGNELDFFFIALVVPQFILSVFISSINSIIIPNYIQEKEKNPKNIGNFTFTAMCINFIVGFTLCVVCIVFYKNIISIFSYNNSKDKFENITQIHFYFLLPSVLFSTISDSISALLNSRNKYLITSLTPLYPVIFTIICLYFFLANFGIYSLSIGFTFGYFCELITMIIVFKIEKFPFEFIFKFTKSIKTLIGQAFHKTSASLFAAFVPVVNQFFAVRQVAGSVSLITYAQKVPLFINVVLTMSIGVTILPYFSNKVASSFRYKPKDYYSLISMFFFGSLLICLVLFMLSGYVVKMLFLKGKINIHDINIIDQLQKIYFSQLPFYFVAIVAIKLLTALNKNKHTLYGAIMSLIIIGGLNYLFEKPYGIYGIALATVGATIINMLINLWFSIVDLNKAYTNE
jgi:putative peptidoglycan lipid II flippase